MDQNTDKLNVEQTEANAQPQENPKTKDNPHPQEKEQPAIKTPFEITQMIAKGKLKLVKPIRDGEVEHDELVYDFNSLSGWELARALDNGDSRDPYAKNLTDTQAISLFAAAAGKCTKGLDARDIKDRMGPMDAIAAIRIAAIFFNGSLVAGSMRITNE